MVRPCVEMGWSSASMELKWGRRASVTIAVDCSPWQGCRMLREGQVFLMNWDEPASLDGRYFGPIHLSAIVGRAEPLWTFEEK